MATFGVSLGSDSAGPVVAGSRVSGKVWAEVKKELSGKSLTAFMYGEEVAKVRYTTGSGDNRRTETARATRPLLQVDIPINQHEILVNGKVPPGRYELPFEIELPEALPSSMECSSQGGSCSIRYYIKVQLKGSGWISDYKARRDVIVTSKPLPKDPVPCVKEPVTEKVNFCCCFDKGTISFGAKVDDTILERGEAVRVAMSCVNDTSSSISQVRAMLKERVEWSAHGRRNFKEQIMSTVDFGKVAGMDRKTGSEINLKKSGVNFEKENFDLIFQDIQSGSCSGVIRNPEEANDSYCGGIITIQHHLIIDVKTSGCVDNPQIIIPIQSGTPSKFAGSNVPAPGSFPEPAAFVELPTNFSDGATVVSPVFVPGNAAAVGGIAVESEDDKPEISLSIPTIGEVEPSLPNLMRELHESVRDRDIIEDKLADKEWRPVFVNLKPMEFADIIGKVDLDFDQPKVAQLIAPAILDGEFKCTYLLAALRTASNWNRVNIVEKLLPFCVDLANQQDTIKAELSDWEKTVTEQAFKGALKTRS